MSFSLKFILLRLFRNSRLQARFLIFCFLLGIFALVVTVFLLHSTYVAAKFERTSITAVFNFSKTSFTGHKIFGETVNRKTEARGRLFLESFDDVVVHFREELRLPDSDTIVKAYVPPLDYGHMPRLSNGYIATLPFYNAMFIGGVYNGARLAKLPAFLNQRVIDALVDGTTRSVAMSTEYSFHVLSGIFKTKATSPLFEMSQLMYCHKAIPNLFVMDITIKRPSNVAPRVAPSLSLRLQQTLIETPDLEQISVNVAAGQSYYREPTLKSLRTWLGQTKLPEWDDLGGHYVAQSLNSSKSQPKSNSKFAQSGTFVSVHYDEMPLVMEFERGQAKKRWIFLSSYGGDSRESLKGYQLGKKLATEERLLDSHVAEWFATWNNGRLVIEGNSTLSAALLSSQYAMLSAIAPQEDGANDELGGQKFPGLPLCGLAPVNMSACEFGLVTFDQEYAMVPSLFSLQPLLARRLVASRVAHLATAVANAARVHSKTGAAFPWLAATSGLELHPDRHLAQYNPRASGLVAASMKLLYLYAIKPDIFLYQSFVDAAVGIAEFYASHLNAQPVEGSPTVYNIPHVIGPYDQSFIVNNSLPINVLAKLSLKFAASLLPSHSEASAWSQMATAIPIPVARGWWDVWKVHDGFTYSTDVRLSDFAFLLPEFTDNLPNKTLSKMLETYLPLYGEQTGFGLALFITNYLRVGAIENAQTSLDRLIHQFSSTYYRVPLSEELEPSGAPSTSPDGENRESTNSSTATGSVKRNSAFWIWLCGPNEITMTASNCLASAAALPYALTWGWLGFRPSEHDYGSPNVKATIDVITFHPISPLPQGVSKIKLLNWQLPAFGDASALSVIWNGTVFELLLDNKQPLSVRSNKSTRQCSYFCVVGSKLYKFRWYNGKKSSGKRSLSIMIRGRENVQIKLTCIPS